MSYFFRFILLLWITKVTHSILTNQSASDRIASVSINFDRNRLIGQHTEFHLDKKLTWGTGCVGRPFLSANLLAVLSCCCRRNSLYSALRCLILLCSADGWSLRPGKLGSAALGCLPVLLYCLWKYRLNKRWWNNFKLTIDYCTIA